MSRDETTVESNVMIEARNLTKKFKDFTAVDDVSFDVKKGEIFGLLGPNGAGKSTTIRMLTTLTRPSSGTVKIGGHDVVKDDDKVRGLVGLVSEKMIMYDRLTARENLWFFGRLYNIPNDVLSKRIDDLLEMVQLSQWKNAMTGTFSTGMRQRIFTAIVPCTTYGLAVGQWSPTNSTLAQLRLPLRLLQRLRLQLPVGAFPRGSLGILRSPVCLS